MADDGRQLIEWATADRRRRYERRLRMFWVTFWGLLLLTLPLFYFDLFIAGVGCGALALVAYFVAPRFFTEFAEEHVTPKEIARAQVAGVQVPESELRRSEVTHL
jgi:hypothetical protein